MAVGSMSAKDALARAVALLKAGEDQACLDLLAPLLPPKGPAPALALCALAASRLGQLERATAWFEVYLRQVPNDAAGWSNFGNLLRAASPQRAIACYRRALALQPAFRDARLNLATLHAAQQQHDEVIGLLNRAELAGDAAFDALLGAACLRANRWAEAVPPLRRQLDAAPRDDRIRLQLAIALRGAGAAAAALAVMDEAADPAAAGFELERAAIELEAGEPATASARLQRLLAAHPAYLPAHEMTDKIHFELGEHARVGLSLDTAWEATGDAALGGVLLRRLERIGDYPRARAVAERLGEAAAAQPELAAVVARLAVVRGDTAAAAETYSRAIERFPADVPLALDHCRFLLVGGNVTAAARRLEALAAADPDDLQVLANLGTAWKLEGDARHRWLFDTGRLVGSCSLFEHGLSPARLEQIAAFLRAHHRASHAPMDQSLRGGTQTIGNLFALDAEPIRWLREATASAVAAHLRQLPRDAKHPFLRHIQADFHVAGAWSVRLQTGGFHVAHTHSRGWLSSATYIALPPGLGGDEHEGWLQFGRSDLGLASERDPPDALVEPAPGKLVLFPSYLWHGTVPFRAAGERLTVAFDVRPGR